MNIHILSLLGVATIAQVSTAMAQTAPKVNILFCVADDAGHMSAYGVPWINTPAFDTVARNGLLFNNMYTCNAKSAPSRAAMITGRNSWQLEEACNHWPNFVVILFCPIYILFSFFSYICIYFSCTFITHIEKTWRHSIYTIYFSISCCC